jgi:hypothetical protein
VLAVDMDSYWHAYARFLGEKVAAALAANRIDSTVQGAKGLLSICIRDPANHALAQRVLITTLRPLATHGQFFLTAFGANCFEISLAQAERDSVASAILIKSFESERKHLDGARVAYDYELLTNGRIGMTLRDYSDQEAVRRLFAGSPMKIVELKPMGAGK